MARNTWVGCGVWMSLLLFGPLAQAGQAVPATATRAPRVQLADAALRAAVTRAVVGAVNRLTRPSCQHVFTDFADESGQPLLARLEASGRTAAQYLIEQVWFVDGETATVCRRDDSSAAFTTPGSHVVRVCPVAFTNRVGRDTTAAELVVIHELLHTLGLGENPPSSREITWRVTGRCGGS
jgi:hypothetical protein